MDNNRKNEQANDNININNLNNQISFIQPEDHLEILMLAIESTNNGIAISDLSGKLMYVNPSFLKMWGYDTKDEVLGRSTLGYRVHNNYSAGLG